MVTVNESLKALLTTGLKSGAKGFSQPPAPESQTPPPPPQAAPVAQGPVPNLQQLVSTPGSVDLFGAYTAPLQPEPGYEDFSAQLQQAVQEPQLIGADMESARQRALELAQGAAPLEVPPIYEEVDQVIPPPLDVAFGGMTPAIASQPRTVRQKIDLKNQNDNIVRQKLSDLGKDKDFIDQVIRDRRMLGTDAEEAATALATLVTGLNPFSRDRSFSERGKQLAAIKQMRTSYEENPEYFEKTYADAVFVDRFRETLTEEESITLEAFNLSIHDYIGNTEKWERSGLQEWSQLQSVGRYLRNYQDSYIVPKQSEYAARVLEGVRGLKRPLNPLSKEGLDEISTIAAGEKISDTLPLYSASTAPSKAWLVYQTMSYLGVSRQDLGPSAGEKLKAMITAYDGAETEAERVRVAADYVDQLVSPAPGASVTDLARHKEGLLRMMSKSAPIPRSQWAGVYTSAAGVPVFPIPDALYFKALDISGQRGRIDLDVFLKTMDPLKSLQYLSGQTHGAAKLIDLYGGPTRSLVGRAEELTKVNLGAAEIEQYSEIANFMHNLKRSPDLIHLPAGARTLNLAKVLTDIETFRKLAPRLDAVIKMARDEQGRWGKVSDAVLDDAYGMFLGPLVFAGGFVKDVGFDLPLAVGLAIPAAIEKLTGVDVLGFAATTETDPSTGKQRKTSSKDLFLKRLKSSATTAQTLVDFTEYAAGGFTNVRKIKDRWSQTPLSMGAMWLVPLKPIQKVLYKTSALGLLVEGVPYALRKAMPGATTGYTRKAIERAAQQADVELAAEQAGVKPDASVGVVENPKEYAKTYLDNVDEFESLRLDEQVVVLQKSGPVVAAQILSNLDVGQRTSIYTQLGFSLRRGLDKVFEKANIDLNEGMLVEYYSDLLGRLEAEGIGIDPGAHKNINETGRRQDATGQVIRQLVPVEEQFGAPFKERVDATESSYQREVIWDLNEILDHAFNAIEDLGFEDSQTVLDSILTKVQQELIGGQGGQVPDVGVRLSTADGLIELTLAEWILTSESVLSSQKQARSIMHDLLENKLDPANYKIKIKRMAEDGSLLEDAPTLTLEDLRLVKKTPEGNYIATNKLKELIESSTETLLDGAAPESVGARVDALPSITVADQVNGLQWLWKNSDGPVVVHSAKAWTASRPSDLRKQRVQVSNFEGKTPEEVARLKQQEVEIKQLNSSIDYKYSADDFDTFAKEMGLDEVFATGDETVVALAQEALGDGFEVRKTTTKSLVETEAGFFVEKTNTLYYLENTKTGRAVPKKERALRDVAEAADDGAFVKGVYDLRQNDLGGLFYKAGRSKEALQLAATLELLARKDHARSIDSIKNSEALRRLERGDDAPMREILGDEHFNALERITQNGIYPLLHRATQMLSPYALEGFMYYLKHERFPDAVKPDSAVVQSWANAGLWDIDAGKPTVFGRAASVYRLRYANDWYETLFTRAVMDNAPKHGGPQGAFFSYKNILGEFDPVLVEALEPYISDIQTLVANDVAMHRSSGLYEGNANAAANMLTYWRMEWSGTYKDAMVRYGSMLKNQARASVVTESVIRKQANNEKLTAKEQSKLDFIDQAAEKAGHSNNVGLGLNMAEAAFLTRSFLKARMKSVELFAEGVSKGLVRVGLIDDKGNSAPPGPSKYWVPIEKSAGIPDHAQRAIILKYAPDLIDPTTGNPVAGAKLYATKAYADLFNLKAQALQGVKETIYKSANETWGDKLLGPVASTIEGLASMGESMMATEFVKRIKVNKLFRGATGGSVRNHLFALSSYIAQDPAAVASLQFRQATVAYLKYITTGQLPADAKMRAYLEFALSEGLVQEVFLRETGDAGRQLQGTRLASLDEKVKAGDIEIRKKQRQQIASKDALTEAQRKNDTAEIQRLEEEIALIEEGIDILVLDEYSKTFTEAVSGALEFLLDPSGGRTASSTAAGAPAALLDVVEAFRSAGVQQINKHIGKPLRKISPLLDDLMKHLATGGAEINDVFTRTMAQLFVAGDDAPRFAYGYTKYDSAVKANDGRLKLPAPVMAKVRKLTMDKAPDYTRNSNAIKGMRVLDMWAFFPWKQAQIAAKLLAKKPHLAAFWMYQYNAWNAGALQDVEESFGEVLNMREGYGRSIPGPFGPVGGDFFSYLPNLSTDLFTNSTPVKLFDVLSELKSANPSAAIDKWNRLTTGGIQVNPEATVANGVLALLPGSERFKDHHDQILAGGRHMEKLRDAIVRGRHRRQNTSIADAIASAFLSYDPIRKEPYKKFYSEVEAASQEADRIVRRASNKQSFVKLWETVSGGTTSATQRERINKNVVAAEELLKYPEDARGLVVWVHMHGLHRNKAWSTFSSRFKKVLEQPSVKESLRERGYPTDLKYYFPFTEGGFDELAPEEQEKMLQKIKQSAIKIKQNQNNPAQEAPGQVPLDLQ